MFEKLKSATARSAGRLVTGVATGVAALATAAAVALSVPGVVPGVVPAASGTSATHADRRGEVVSAEHLRAISAEDVAAELTSDGWDPGAVRHGVDAYRLVYRTVDARGEPTTASGLLALPRNGDRSLRTVSFTHGTAIFRGEAPSVATDVWGSAPALTYASAGFAAVAPDYLGLGVGPGPHPWAHVPSETTASLDMLRAARSFAPETGRELEREVLLTGFSQGASTALGLARALQEGADEHFRVQAVAPISGGYDFQHAQFPAMLDGELHPVMSMGYTAYFIVAWDRLHDLYEEPGEMFKAPYDQKLEAVFDGEHTGEDLLAALPGNLGELLTPRAEEMLRNPTGRLAEALRERFAVCSDWTPKVPVRLYMIGDDSEAATANTDNCQAALRARGVDAPVIDLGEGDHINSNRLGAAQVVRWFSALR